MCFLASAGLLYLSQHVAIEIGENAVARQLKEVVQLASRLPDPRARDASRILLTGELVKVTRGCRYAGSSTVTLLTAVTPLLGGIAAGIVLMVIDPVLTSTLALAAALWCVLLYPFVRRQLKVTDRLIAGRRAFTVETEQFLQPTPTISVPQTLPSANTLALAPRLRAVARPLRAARPPDPRGAPSPLLTRPACRGDGQRNGVAHAPVPRGGVRRRVLPLRILLPGAGVLREGLPRAGATAATAAGDRQASA